MWDILSWLGAGMTEAQILEEHPDLERVDFLWRTSLFPKPVAGPK